MKKNYMKPTVEVVEIKISGQLMQASGVTEIQGNAGIGGGGAGGGMKPNHIDFEFEEFTD